MADRRPRAFIAWQLPATELPRSLVDLFSALYLNRVDLLGVVKRQKAKVNRDCESIWINDARRGVSLMVIDTQDHEVDVRGERGTSSNRLEQIPLTPFANRARFFSDFTHGSDSCLPPHLPGRRKKSPDLSASIGLSKSCQPRRPSCWIEGSWDGLLPLSANSSCS